MLGDAAERDQVVGIREWPAPAIETDRTAEQHDGFVAKRIGVEARGAEALEPLAAATPLALGSHVQSISGAPRFAKESQLVGIAVLSALLWNRRSRPTNQEESR